MVRGQPERTLGGIGYGHGCSTGSPGGAPFFGLDDCQG